MRAPTDFLNTLGLWGLFARLGVGIAGILLAHFFRPGVTWLLAACIAYTGIALVPLLMLKVGLSHEARFRSFIWIDSLTATFIVWSVGTVTTPIAVLYLLLVTGYMVRAGIRFGTLSFALSLSGFAAVVLLEVGGILPHAPLGRAMAPSYFGHTEPVGLLAVFAVGFTAFFVVLLHYVRRLQWQSERAAELVAAERAADARSAELQAQLDRAQRLESLGRLAGGIAHDFNNVLTTILVHAGIVRDGLSAQDPRRTDLDTVVNSAEHAAELTGQLLTFARKQPSTQRVLELNESVTAVGRMLERVLGEDIQLRLELAREPGRVLADAVQIERVLVNLAVNARDAMPDGGTLTIATSDLEIGADEASERGDLAPGSYVSVAVADTGSGIPAVHLEQIFDPFFTTKELGRGTGLGLAMAYAVARQLGGTLAVTSSPENGSRFTLFLPRTDEAVPMPAPMPTPVAADRSEGGSETILLVEDEEPVRNVTARVLRRAGYDVIEAASGDEGLKLLRDNGNRINLLLTDVVMPGMSGTDLAQRTRALQPDLRVLLVSGYAPSEIASARDDGRTDILPKPFDASTLLRGVRGLLDGAVAPPSNN